MVSLYTLMGLSVERWLIISHPGKYSLNSNLTSNAIIVSAWILGLATSAPPLFGWAYFAPETSGMRFAILTKSEPCVWPLLHRLVFPKTTHCFILIIQKSMSLIKLKHEIYAFVP